MMLAFFILSLERDKNDLKKRNDFLNLPHHSLTNIKENGKNKIINRTESFERKVPV